MNQYSKLTTPTLKTLHNTCKTEIARAEHVANQRGNKNNTVTPYLINFYTSQLEDIEAVLKERE